MVLENLFGWRKKKEEEPDIPIGRYSDNNKSIEKVRQWTQSETLFKHKEYGPATDAFFDYLTDDEQENVVLEREEKILTFRIYQGSTIVRGEFDQQRLWAEVVLARMPEPSIPVMRRLLEMNFHLYYSRFAMSGDQIRMRFDTDIETATPNKLYYGLKELATRADKQDDLLVDEFGFLEPVDTAHIIPIPDQEKEIKYEFMHRWIRATFDYIDELDMEKFSGGISYLLLTLVFRIDYLILPEGKMLSELEKIASTYYGKDDKSAPERNPAMIQGFRELLEKDKTEIFSQLFRSKYTFAIVVPQDLKTVYEAIETALQNMVWYRDNNYPEMASKVMEYGFAYCQYAYSLPKPLSDLFDLFMRVNYPDYFNALGFKTVYYDRMNDVFHSDPIEDRINTIVQQWKPKYGQLFFKTKKLKYDSLISFNQSFLQEILSLNFE